MKRNFDLSPRHQKWGLFLLLTGTLGFNLSMNPDHFNNIARHEVGSIHTMDLAATAAEVKAVDQEKSSSSSEERKSSETSENPPPMIVRGNKGVFKATVFTANQVAFAKFESVEDVEGRDCELCKLKAIPLQSSIDKLSDLSRELQAIADGKLDTKKTTTSSAPKKNQKLDASELDRAALSEMAKECKSKKGDERMNCHADVLVKLSQKLDESAESQKVVKAYFDSYLLQSLLANYSTPVADPISLQVDTSKMSSAEDLALRLVSELNEDNSKPVIDTLTRLKAGSYSAQTRAARELYMIAQNEKSSKDMMTMSHGYNLERLAAAYLNPSLMTQQLWNDSSSWKNAFVQGDKEDLQNLVTSNIYNPVQGLIGQLSSINLLGANGQNQLSAAQQLAQLNIPDLSNLGPASGYMNPSALPGSTPLPGAAAPGTTTPALPGSIPINSGLASRLSTPGRGAGLATFGNVTNPTASWLTPNNTLMNPSVAPSTITPGVAIPNQGALQQRMMIQPNFNSPNMINNQGVARVR